MFKFHENLPPRARYKETDVVIANEGALPLGAVIFAYVWVGMTASQSLKLRVEFR